MGKVKEAKTKSKGSSKPLSTINAGVTKAANSSSVKAKKLAKDIANKAVNGKENKKKSSKKVEVSSSESESESEEPESDSSESESESEEPEKKVSSEADSDSDEESEDEESEEEAKPVKEKKDVAKLTKKKVAEESSDSSDEEFEEEAKVNGKAKAESDASSDESDDSEEGSDESESDSDEAESESESASEEKAEAPSKKRKAADDAEEEAEAPVKKTKTEDSDKPCTLFVGNLTWNIDDDALFEEFKGYGELLSARVITDREGGRSRGFGYVDFSTPEAAEKAFNEKNGQLLDGRDMRLDFAQKRSNDGTNDRAKKHGDVISPESDTLFVANISWNADEDAVRNFFSDVAQIQSLRLPTDPNSGQPRGFGYATFYSVEDAKNAFEAKNGADLNGRAVRLDYAKPRDNNAAGGGGGFGGGGRGGGRGGRGGPRGGGGRGSGRGGGRGGFNSNRGGGGFQGKKITF